MKYLYLISILFISYSTAFAQDEVSQSYLSVGVGTGFTQSYYANYGMSAPFASFLLQSIASNVLDDEENQNEQSPTFSFNYDNMLSDRFSLGASYTYQKADIKINKSYFNPETGVLTLTQQNIAIRGFLHYIHRKRFRLYSGLRIGLNFNQIKVESTDSGWGKQFEKIQGMHFAAQIVGLAARVTLFNDFFVNAELCVGPPYLFYLGAGARF